MRTVLCLLSALLIGACGATPAPPDPLEGLVARYDASPQQVLAALRAEPDPIAQEAAVLRLCEARPGQTGQICAVLPPGAARSRCERFNARPHLWSIGSQEQQPTVGRLGLPARAAARWQDLLPDPEGCAPADHACLEDRAAAHARSGAVEAAAAVCAAFDDTRLREDCFFARSEEVPYGSGLYGAAVQLCAGSGRYAHECHGHLLLRLRADAQPPLDPAQLATQAAEIQAYWTQAQEPVFAAQAEDLYWATVASRTLGTARPFPEPAVLAALPEAVQPHVRSAVALRVLNEADPLAAAQAALRGERPDLPRAMMPPAVSKTQPWRGLLGQPGDPALAQIFFNDVRGGLRPTHPDPAVDLALAVMTAMAVRNPPRTEVIGALARDAEAHEVVRWGAQRLLGSLSGQAGAGRR